MHRLFYHMFRLVVLLVFSFGNTMRADSSCNAFSSKRHLTSDAFMSVLESDSLSSCYLSLLLASSSLSSGLLKTNDVLNEKKRVKKKVKLLLDWWPNPNHVPLFAGLSKGFFEEEGIDLEIIKSFDAPQAIPFLTANQADIVIYYMPQTLLSKSKGHNFKVIGKLVDKPLQGFIFKKNSGIKKAADLKGRKIGLFPDGLTQSILNDLPFKIEKKILQMDLITPLYLDMVDVITGAFSNIEPIQLAEIGVSTESISFQEVGMPTYHELIFLAKDNSLKKPFQKALQKSIDFAQEQSEEAFFLYKAKNPDKAKKVLVWEKKAWDITRDYLPSSQDMDEAIWQSLCTWLQEKKYLENQVQLNELF